MPDDVSQLASIAKAKRAAGRHKEAAALLARLVDLDPTNIIAEHNLAAAYGDLGHWRSAERHIRSALAKGGNAPESWLILARALVVLNRFDEANAAFAAALQRRPNYGDALRDLAQLRWMRTGDAEAALFPLSQAMAASSDDPSLALVKGLALENMGRRKEAYALLLELAARWPGQQAIVTSASQITQTVGDHDEAVRLASLSAGLGATTDATLIAHATACLGAGLVELALPSIAQLRERAPDNQHGIALEASAWRLTNDPRYHAVYDYDALVDLQTLTPPNGWPDLETYLADLSGALRNAHIARAHPFNQSIKGGTQVASILDVDRPATQALPAALSGPIARYLEGLGAGGDPLRARNTGSGYDVQGIWSIRMNAGGHHVSHVHPQGWISAVCYLSAPDGMPPPEGHLALGEPGFSTRTPMPAERFIAPRPGMIVLFPSYMWHGTVPFSGEGERLTFAFDLTPA